MPWIFPGLRYRATLGHCLALDMLAARPCLCRTGARLVALRAGGGDGLGWLGWLRRRGRVAGLRVAYLGATGVPAGEFVCGRGGAGDLRGRSRDRGHDDFPAADQPAAGLCMDRVRGCEVYVGVLGTRYGSPVRDKPEVSAASMRRSACTSRSWPPVNASWARTTPTPWPRATTSPAPSGPRAAPTNRETEPCL